MKVDMAVQKTFFNKINSLVPLEKKNIIFRVNKSHCVFGFFEVYT